MMAERRCDFCDDERPDSNVVIEAPTEAEAERALAEHVAANHGGTPPARPEPQQWRGPRTQPQKNKGKKRKK